MEYDWTAMKKEDPRIRPRAALMSKRDLPAEVLAWCESVVRFY